MSTVVIWILSLTSFYTIDEPNDSEYWTLIFDGISSDLTYTTDVTALPYINNDQFTAANMLKVTMEFHFDNGTSYNQFLELTDDLTPATIASLIQSDVSSGLDYYIIASIYEDPDTDDLIEVSNTNLVPYSGENGLEQTQSYPTDDSLTCISPIYIECGITSNVDTLSEIKYVNIWDELLPNTSTLASSQPTFTMAAGLYSYHISKRALGQYYTLDEYEWDYDFNDGFSLSGIEANLYDLVDGLNGKENTVDVNCFVSVTACGDTEICDIKLPWCDGTETDYDGDNGPIGDDDGVSTNSMRYIFLIVIFVNFITY